MYPHRIRLRGPWQCEPLDAARRRHRRHFGYPGRIDDYERVWLTATGLTGHADVTLNSQPLGPAHPTGFEYDITPLLQARNAVLIDVDEGVRWDEVALEVRRTAFLRAVAVVLKDGRLHIDGEIAGSAEKPLELYAVVDRRTAAYGKASAGDRFSLVSDPIELTESSQLRLDLVDGASVWYTLERSLHDCHHAKDDHA